MTKHKNSIFLLIIAGVLATSLFSCKPDTSTCTNCEVELITSLYVTLTDSATGTVSQFAFRDLDGDGANAPVQFDTIKVQANHTYHASLLVLDESKIPADTISNEIAAEANDHQFFFHVHGAQITIDYQDFDSNNPPLPIGLLTKWTAGALTGNSAVNIMLRHQPGIKDGSGATGDVDLMVDFKAAIE